MLKVMRQGVARSSERHRRTFQAAAGVTGRGWSAHVGRSSGFVSTFTFQSGTCLGHWGSLGADRLGASVVQVMDALGALVVSRPVSLQVGPTGVEMEALVACATAALTVYDMVKAASKEVVITDVRLLHKSGGKSGEFRRGS